MKPQLALRISGVAYICLGLMVFSVLWIAPDVGIPEAKANPTASDAIMTTARGWGDINGCLFVGVGCSLLLVSNAASAKGAGSAGVLNAVLTGNFLLACALMGFAIFHTVVLNHGPPPPVFIAVGTSLVASYFSDR